MKIRSDDPVAMKTFIISIQNKTNEIKTSPDCKTDINKFTVSNLAKDSLLEEIFFFLIFKVVSYSGLFRWKRCLKPLLQSRTTS